MEYLNLSFPLQYNKVLVALIDTILISILNGDIKTQVSYSIVYI